MSLCLAPSVGFEPTVYLLRREVVFHLTDEGIEIETAHTESNSGYTYVVAGSNPPPMHRWLCQNLFLVECDGFEPTQPEAFRLQRSELTTCSADTLFYFIFGVFGTAS